MTGAEDEQGAALGIELDAAELETLILAMLRARNMPGVEVALKALAVKDPDRALLVLETLGAGVAIATRAAATSASERP